MESISESFIGLERTKKNVFEKHYFPLGLGGLVFFFWDDVQQEIKNICVGDAIRNVDFLQSASLALFGVVPRPMCELHNENLACLREEHRGFRTDHLKTKIRGGDQRLVGKGRWSERRGARRDEGVGKKEKTRRGWGV